MADSKLFIIGMLLPFALIGLLISVSLIVYAASEFGDIVPLTNNTYNLGNSTRMWKNVNATRIFGNIDCTYIDGGSDADYCTDGGGGGTGVNYWSVGSGWMFPNSTAGGLNNINITNLNVTTLLNVSGDTNSTRIFENGVLLSNKYVSRSDWTTIDNYPTACTNQAVTGLADALTCASLTNAYLTSGIFNAITGLGTFTTGLNMGSNPIANAGLINTTNLNSSGWVNGTDFNASNEIYYKGQILDNRFLLATNIIGTGILPTQIVYTNGSYADPSWLTSLSSSKLSGVIADSLLSSNIYRLNSSTIDAGNVSSGIFSILRIPALDTGNITSGIFSILRIPALSSGNITSGTLSDNLLSSNVYKLNSSTINANNITSGTLAQSLLPSSVYLLNSSSISGGNITSGTIGTDILPTNLIYDNKSATLSVGINLGGNNIANVGTINATIVNATGWINTTVNMNATRVYTTYTCYSPDCLKNITYNGTNLVLYG